MALESEHAGFGVLLVDKPAGPTSHDVVDWVRWSTKLRAVGHCGTLDPAATGLLVLCVGAATRLATDLTAVDKTYDATFRFGLATDTGDAEGEVQRSTFVSAACGPRLVDVVAGLSGALSLPPPSFSAVRVDGVRAHELARTGKGKDLAPRPMIVWSTSAPQVSVGEGVVDVTASLRVSKGTYVRSLAVELGRRAGLPCHLAALRRTRCGALGLDDALDQLVATRLPDRANGAPCWRIRGANAPDRESCAALVEGGLRDPGECVPYPVLEAMTPRQCHVLERLAHGQAVGDAGDLPFDLPITPPDGARASAAARFAIRGTIGDERLFALVEARRQPSPTWAPIRVIRPRISA